MEIQIRITGVVMLLLALLHIRFPRYFNWKEELKSLSLINRQMMTVHMFFIALMVFLMGLLCLTSAPDLAGTALGKLIALGMGIFWTTRLVFQLFVYSARLWRGKRFETSIHILFVLLWTYLGGIFVWTALA